MQLRRIVANIRVLAMLLLLGSCHIADRVDSTSTTAHVLFVCEHGSVKSVMAASFFNQAAAQRGLPFHAISKGIAPDEKVPDRIVAALAQDGLDVSGFRPERVTSADISAASRVIGIEVDLTSFGTSTSRIERWDDVPATSVNYAVARGALKRHVNLLLERLEAQR